MATRRRKLKSRTRRTTKTGQKSKWMKLVKKAKRSEKMALKKVGTLTRKINSILKQHAAKIRKLRKEHMSELKKLKNATKQGFKKATRKAKSVKRKIGYQFGTKRRPSAKRRSVGKKTYGFRRRSSRRSYRKVA